MVSIDLQEELINKCKEHNRKAQYELYSRYSRAMFNTAFRITNSYDDAQDAMQEAFISAFNKINTFKGDATFGAWLKRIVINAALNKVKTESKFVPEESPSLLSDDMPESTYEEPAYSVENIRSAMEKLPSGFRTVLSLYLFEGYDHQEIAEILNISVSTSKTQYVRGKQRLKNILLDGRAGEVYSE